MENHHKITSLANHNGFEFDYNHNVIFFGGKVIRLSPHESDILRVLLNNRARPTPIGVLIQRVYGANEPESAAVSIRVAIHSLRKKILGTGMSIQVEPRVGYEIEASHIPELNRRLNDKILVALNMARSSGEHEIVIHLEQALGLAEIKRAKWLKDARSLLPALAGRVGPIADLTLYPSGSSAAATRRSSPISTL
jgi:DNA-binding winged helix-turn-helix (wHTH) protein